MTAKRFFTTLLIVILICATCIPLPATSAHMIDTQQDKVIRAEDKENSPQEAPENSNDLLPEDGSQTEDSNNTEDNADAGKDAQEIPSLAPEEIVEQKKPSFTAELMTEGERPGLYVTLENAPSDLSLLRVDYSFGGLSYNLPLEGQIWDEFTGFVDDENNLTLFCATPDQYPLAAYLSEAVNSLYIKMAYMTSDYSIEELPPIRFSHNKTYPIPETPPPFSADIKLGWFSYSVLGHFSDFAPNVAKVCNTYSWGGLSYQYSDPDYPTMWEMTYLGNNDPQAIKRLENQEVAQYYEEPLESFLAGDRDSFYLRLEITTEDNQVYYSEAVQIARQERQLVPEHLQPSARFGFDLAVKEMHNRPDTDEDGEDEYIAYTHGEYQLSVREDATSEEIMALLPETVPVRVLFWDKTTKEKYLFGDIACPVEWKDIPPLSLTPGEPLVLSDMAKPLVIPRGTDVVTALGTYTLRKPLTFKSNYDSDTINLIINPVGVDEKPNIALRAFNRDLGDYDETDPDRIEPDAPLTLAFWHKPSGATAIKAFAVVDEKKTELFDLPDRRDINHNQSHELYGYIELCQSNEYPLRDYLDGTIDEFFIELEIEGGTYDGMQVTLPWPFVYDLPVEIPDPDGFEGQENNAGSDSGIWDDEDSTSNGGQRPTLPGDQPSPPPVDPDLPPENTPVLGELLPPQQPIQPEINDDTKILEPVENTTPEDFAAMNNITPPPFDILDLEKSGIPSDAHSKPGTTVAQNKDANVPSAIEGDDALPTITEEAPVLDKEPSQPPPRTSKEESKLPLVLSGVLLIGGIVGVTTGAFPKLLAIIKNLFIRP